MTIEHAGAFLLYSIAILITAPVWIPALAVLGVVALAIVFSVGEWISDVVGKIIKRNKK